MLFLIPLKYLNLQFCHLIAHAYFQLVMYAINLLTFSALVERKFEQI